jgi:hypothetical protein
MKHFNEGHLFGTLRAKSDRRKCPVIFLSIASVLGQEKWMMNPMRLPKRYAVVQIVEDARKRRILLDGGAVVGIETDEEIRCLVGFGSLKRTRGEGSI